MVRSGDLSSVTGRGSVLREEPPGAVGAIRNNRQLALGFGVLRKNFGYPAVLELCFICVMSISLTWWSLCSWVWTEVSFTILTVGVLVTWVFGTTHSYEVF